METLQLKIKKRNIANVGIKQSRSPGWKQIAPKTRRAITKTVGIKQSRSPGWKPSEFMNSYKVIFVGIRQSRLPGWKLVKPHFFPRDGFFRRNQTIPLAGMNLFIRCPFPNFPRAIASKMMARKLHMEPERGAPWKKASFQSNLAI